MVGRRVPLWLTAALAIAAVAACQQAEPSGGDSSSAIPGATSAATPTALDSSVQLTESQAQGLRLTALQAEAKNAGLPDSDIPPLVRWINILDFPTVTADCLTSSGFPSVAQNGTVRTSNLPVGQRAAFALAQLQCHAKYSIHPYYNLPRSVQAEGKYYDWLVSTAVPCLTGQGLAVTPAPSREVYLGTPSPTRWFPWDKALTDQLQQRGRTAQADLDKVCPMNPGLTAFDEFDPVPRGSS